MRVHFTGDSVADYERFLAVRRLPVYSIHGEFAEFPDEYASLVGLEPPAAPQNDFVAPDFMFDYQADTTRIAIAKEKFAVFARCGLGKTLIMLEFAKNTLETYREKVLIVSPLMVIEQTIEEAKRFYGAALPIEWVEAKDLPRWLETGAGIGITNYEALNKELPRAVLAGLIAEEAATLKSHYGKWGRQIIRLSRGVPRRLSLTGTPAPNDRIEYAQQAVFLGAARTVNEFLATYFINRGQTQNRWELKPHALQRFYRDLSHWAIFLNDPSVYGWKDNIDAIPPINVSIESVELTPEQHDAALSVTGGVIPGAMIGGIGNRSKLGQIAKGKFKGKRIPTNKPEYIRALVDSWPEESTIIWALYDDEQAQLREVFPEAENIQGSTPYEQRRESIRRFKSGESKVILSKGKCLGLGLNLQRCTRMVFSGLQDSYEMYVQCIARANRIGSTRPLNVHIPVTDIERPMIETVLRKAHMVEADIAEQERIFRSEQLKLWGAA